MTNILERKLAKKQEEKERRASDKGKEKEEHKHKGTQIETQGLKEIRERGRDDPEQG